MPVIRMRVSLLACLALTGALLAPSRAALADEASSSTPSAPAPASTSTSGTRTVWYGWQVFLPDAFFVALAVVGASSTQGDSGVEPVALAGYVVGGPFIHIAHRRYLTAGLSGGMRLLLPIIGMGTGAAIASTSCSPPSTPEADPCWAPLGGAIYGFASGLLLASIVDVAALSWERVPAADDAPAPKAAHLSVFPRIAAIDDASHRRVMSFGVAGAF